MSRSSASPAACRAWPTRSRCRSNEGYFILSKKCRSIAYRNTFLKIIRLYRTQFPGNYKLFD
jgi:hypothetical protein